MPRAKDLPVKSRVPSGFSLAAGAFSAANMDADSPRASSRILSFFALIISCYSFELLSRRNISIRRGYVLWDKGLIRQFAILRTKSDCEDGRLFDIRNI